MQPVGLMAQPCPRENNIYVSQLGSICTPSRVTSMQMASRITLRFNVTRLRPALILLHAAGGDNDIIELTAVSRTLFCLRAPSWAVATTSAAVAIPVCRKDACLLQCACFCNTLQSTSHNDVTVHDTISMLPGVFHTASAQQ